jgi:hypothetical protein
VRNHSQEPTWNELITKMTLLEVNIWGCSPGLRKRTRRKLWVAIQRLNRFIMGGVTAENVAAIGRDRQGWIDQQLRRLLGLAEGESIPQRLPSILRLVKSSGPPIIRSTDTGSTVSSQSQEPTRSELCAMLLVIDAKISQHTAGLQERTRRDLWVALHRLYTFLMEAVTDEHVAAAGRDRQRWIDQQLSLLGSAGGEESLQRLPPPSRT